MSPKAEFSTWANAKKHAYEMAEECRTIVCFADKKLVGQKAYLPVGEVHLEGGLQQNATSM